MAKVETGIGKSDLPGLQKSPEKRDFVRHDLVRASALSQLAPANFPRSRTAPHSLVIMTSRVLLGNFA